MNKIIEQLTEIETGAVQIMDSIAPRKQQLSDEYKKTNEQYARQVEEQTAETLSKLTEQLNSQNERELVRVREQAQKTLESLDKEYNENHKAITAQILARILEE